MRFFLAVIALLLAATTFPHPASAETWHRADTRNFILYSDGSRATLEDYARELEMFDALFREYFRLAIEPPPNRLTIYLLKNSDDVGDLAGSDSTAGFYRASSEGSIAVGHRERGRGKTGLSGQAVLQHEYVHHLMARYFTFGYPPWYREGFAEFFATAEFETGGDWTLGMPAQYRAQGLRRVSLPLETVMFGNLGTLSQEARDAYYGRSWLLVHLTVFNPERRSQLVDYLAEVGSGADQREAFATTFGDLDGLEAELDSYLRGRLTAMNSVTPIAIVGTIDVTTLDETTSALVRLQLHRRLGFEKEQTREGLLELTRQYPNAAAILAEYALAQHDVADMADEPDYAATTQALEAALAVDERNPLMNLLKAKLEMERLRLAGTTNNDDWNNARRLIVRSLQADPDNPRAFQAQYDSFIMQGRRPPVEVVNGLGDAFQLAPEAHDIRIAYAYALANENMFDEAIGLVEFLASDPHAGGMGQSVVEELRAFRDRRLDQGMPQDSQ